VVHKLTHLLSNPLFQNLCQRVIPTFNKLIPFETQTVVVAVSGGPDSLILSFLIFAWAKARSLTVRLVHVDHALRPESSAQVLDLQKLLQEMGLTCDILQWHHSPLKTGLQEKARQARYALLTEYCRQHQARYLFLGHHLDDQIETVFMRLFRGSGLTGLRGMSLLQKRGDVTCVRPFLTVEKSVLEALCTAVSLAPIIDPSNEDWHYTRVRWRKVLDGLIKPEEKHDFATALMKIRRAEEAMDHYRNKALQESTKMQELGYACLDRAAFESYPAEIQLRVLTDILQSVSGNAQPMRLKRLARLQQMILSGRQTCHTLQGCLVDLHCFKKVWFYREYAQIPPVMKLTSPSMIWDHRFSIKIKNNMDKNEYYVSPIQYLKINGITGFDLDFLKASDKVISTLPVIYKKTGIVSVPHLNFNPQLFSITYLGMTKFKGLKT